LPPACQAAIVDALMKVLIAGCGYVGIALGEELAARGDEVVGLRRQADTLPASFQPFSADLGDPPSLSGVPSDVQALVFCAGAGRRDADVYEQVYVRGLENILEALRHANAPLERLVFCSSTAVFEHEDGRWVDEDSPALPSAPTAQRLLEAEGIAARACPKSTILRLGGIYGEGRASLLERLRRGELSAPLKTLYTNRIHRQDCAGVIAQLLRLEAPPALLLGVDDEPVPLGDLYAWMAARLGVDAPSAGDPSSFGRFRTSKRCRNARLHDTGYTLRFPSFREGYGALLRERGL